MIVKHLRNGALRQTARMLRTNATKQENHLWYDFLREYPVRFRRQVALDRFIADFYCSKAMLIVEVDGSQHFTENGKAYDAERSAILESFGYKVIRFSNADIDQSFEGVCTIIDLEVQKRVAARSQKKVNTRINTENK